jgi:CHASE2 domain-containing sensor protein
VDRQEFVALIILFAAIGVGALIAWSIREPRLKRRVIQWMIAFWGVLFAGVVAVFIGELRYMLLFGPFIALLCYVNIRSVAICEHCGHVFEKGRQFKKFPCCPRCLKTVEDGSARTNAER